MSRIFRLSLAVAGVLCARMAMAAEAPADGFYRYPSIGGGLIVFAAEGDLWKVPATGGVAVRLTAHEGEEKFPHVSPDGKWVAFTAQYEGNDDVYVMPSVGGEPVRLTFHPMPDQTLGWTADGKILFRSRRDHPHGDFRCYTISPQGGLPEMIRLEPAAWLSFEPNGKRIALTKIGLEFHNWKLYKGGEAEEVYVGTMSPLQFTNVTNYEGKDAFPQWASDGRIYFVTDRWGRANLASMLPDGSDVKQLTKFDQFDVRWPAMGDGKIVYQQKMDLWVYDLTTGSNAQVPVQLPSDRLQVHERFVDPMPFRGSFSLAPDGERIAIETRGDLFITRTHKKGLIRRITESSSARTKFPSFSPDGKQLAAWNDASGEEQLTLYATDNSAPPRTVGNSEPGWHYGPAWSPDGKRLAWGDEKYRLVVTDVGSGKETVVDRGLWEITDYVWSPDSRYIAYSAQLDSGLQQIRIWDGQGGKVHRVSDPLVSSYNPAWDSEGKFIYYLADQYVNPFYDRLGDARFVVGPPTQPIVVALRDGEALPFAPRGDTDPPGTKKPEEQPGGEPGKEPAPPKPKKVGPIKIDFDGLGERTAVVPIQPGNYFGLTAPAGKLHFLSLHDQGLMPWQAPGADEDEAPETDLMTYDFDSEKLATVGSGILAYDMSLDRQVLVVQTKEGYLRLRAGSVMMPRPEPEHPEMFDDPHVDLSGWTLSIHPRDEWAQMAHEAWRIERDFFYDKHMHGVDWNGVWKRYGPLTARIASRDDLEDLLGEMLGELHVGHAYHWPGDLRRGKPVGTGLLAADLTYDPGSGFWRIDQIYRGDYPDPDWSSPLARSDLGVKPGMWLVAIDGRPLVKGEDYMSRLAGRAGQEVELSISNTAKAAGARRIVVKTVGGDQQIRYADWIRRNREYVSKRSKGQIGYLHLYDMGGLGLRQFARDYIGQWNKRGFIIDDRWNHGGSVAQLIVAHLGRRLLSVGGTRNGTRYTTPDKAFTGHMAVLINRQGGSDCETLALMAKEFNLGPVIGTRTWGGWVGIRGGVISTLRDHGMVTVPEFGGWDPTGKRWLIEGHGVDPDVELDLGPDGLLGKDVQLDYAIDDLMTKIGKDPRNLPGAPPVPPR